MSSLTPAATANWNYPTAIRFGIDRTRELPDACRALNMTSPLIVTDRGLAKMAFVSDAVALCNDAGLPTTLFGDVDGNPVEANVNAGVSAMRERNHDGVVALGGGSALDAGKAIALMVGQDRPIWDFEDREDWFTRVNTQGMVPVVAVPTTAGTGSEVGRASVITDVSDHTKKIIFHPNMLPEIVIADPRLTVGLPRSITAAVGMDALSHNLEAFCSLVFHPMAHGIAVEGMRLIKRFLTAACENGDDLEARAQMLVASTMGATAFQKGLGAMHSMSHPCGAVLNAHHGLTNAVVMPYVLEFNRPMIEPRLADLAGTLGLSVVSYEGVMDWILNLRQSIGIPHTLAEIGVRDEHIHTLAPMAVADPSSSTNPKELTVDNMSKLFQRAITGTLDG